MQQDTLVTDYTLRDRTKIIMDLAELRKDWEELAGPVSLLKIKLPVGLVLSDIADKLKLTDQERHAFMGGRLANEVNCFNETRIRALQDY